MTVDLAGLTRVAALEPLAIFSHDFGARTPLMSYPAVPDEQLHGGERLAVHLYGSLVDKIRSPRTTYMSIWRDPEAYLRQGEERQKPPERILLGSLFGMAPFERPADLLQGAEQYNRLDRANLRLDLVRAADDSYRLESIEIEINHPERQRNGTFRSCWKAGEIGRIDLSLHFHPPLTLDDAARFHLSGRLPRRYNHGADIENEHVSFTASGGALPMPDWVNY